MNPTDAIEQLRQATARVEARTAALASERRRREDESAKRQGALIEQRRKGEHGRDWQVLQQRIDLGQTTEFDIVQGIDLSNEARAVRKQMGEALGKVADKREESGEGPVALTPELSEAQDRLVATLQRLRAVQPPG
ncbi:hypothetical protein G7066_13550 [Leucobacter coleopterorum]|uniref:Uncharacterized protein n=1 Tax=Leucobacter coleopterorum TaxID=2714933 RepID=A0ABX6JYE7_9MICO|nr:hypothetical protein [Leucobacter coleopterorum]QIM19341.1 hypothetical protein G7066_13550 [Leucobacter coleopterorum]